MLDVGSAVATPQHSSSASKAARASFQAAGTAVAQLEQWLDTLDARLPPLRNFILPGGGVAAASLHAARAVARRAERSVVPLVRDGHVDAAVGVYLNRLSDYLFVAARTAVRPLTSCECHLCVDLVNRTSHNRRLPTRAAPK